MCVSGCFARRGRERCAALSGLDIGTETYEHCRVFTALHGHGRENSERFQAGCAGDVSMDM